MSKQYLQILKEHLEHAWRRGERQLEKALPAIRREGCLKFSAFASTCLLCPDKILLDGEELLGPEGILIALYARHVEQKLPQLHPLQSFKELPGSAPYQGAFEARAQQILVPHVIAIEQHKEQLAKRFSGRLNPDAPSGDFSFTLYPLPRIPLYYIFYLPDDEFPAAVTCLFAADACSHLPVDALADVAEYTAVRIFALLK
ncbi:MAG: DUF3786 domain-containing protein [Deltaproteobacteria bacterium]|nr:DUF3786 domain-containing protein [Deltaproteobacteria bacterium]